MNAYENPRLYGVDYRVIDETVEQGVRQAGEAMRNIAEQRRLAYEKLQSDYAKYNDDTYLDRAKGLDEESNRAIMDSVRVNIAEFSNLSEYEKARNINYVKEAKTANKAIEDMIGLVNSGALINKNGKAKHFEFLNDLAKFENIQVKPRKGAVGYTIVHNRTNENGEVVGTEEYDMSEIINMSTKFYDTTDIISGVDDAIMGLVDKAQEGRNNAKYNGKEYTVENLRGTAQSFVEMMDEKEKALYFAEKVDPFSDFAPVFELKEDGSEGRRYSEKEIAAIKLRNTKLIEDHVARSVFNNTVEPPPIKTSGGSGGSGSDATPYELEASRMIYNDFFRAYSTKDPTAIRKYASPLGFEVEINKDRNVLEVFTSMSKEEFVRNRLESETNTETTENERKTIEKQAVEAWGELKKKSGNKRVLTEIPLNVDNKRDIALEFVNTVIAKKKLPYLQFAFQSNVMPTDAEIQGLLNQFGYREGQYSSGDPLEEMGRINNQLFPREEIRLPDGRVVPQ